MARDIERNAKILKAACVLLVVLTLIVGIRKDFLSVSFSQRAAGSQLEFSLILLWTLAFCVYFYFAVSTILAFSKLKHVKLKIVVLISVLIMFIGNLIPYTPNTDLETAKLHVLIAQIASFTLFVSLIILPFAFKYENTTLVKKASSFMGFFICGTIALVAVFGAAGVTEVTCSVVCCIYFYYVLNLLLKKDCKTEDL